MKTIYVLVRRHLNFGSIDVVGSYEERDHAEEICMVNGFHHDDVVTEGLDRYAYHILEVKNPFY